ncbi:MAG TPA: DUF2029 domain-containing protein [Roseiflexaceae bacterium]|nr:DUF2029 domain-containing protein [Roseiflexaceae bacterium]
MARHIARRAVGWALGGLLGLLVAAHLVFFAVHAAHMLGYRYPLDYGEGPLLAQVEQLRAGTPVWRLYSDPAAPPYLVVNYPPLYPLLAALLAAPLGSALLAGRALSLLAAAGCLAALWSLSQTRNHGRDAEAAEKSFSFSLRSLRLDSKPSSTQNSKLKTQHSTLPQLGASSRKPQASSLKPLASSLAALLFLCLPIVREWAVVMRVDMLGVCLGLLGLVALRRGAGRAGVIWAAGLLLASLYVKPSLIAAPAAALLWLAWRERRRALLLGALLLGGGALLFGLLQAASGGWFALHVLTANANVWELKLAQGFWRDQLAILWPLVAAGLLGAALAFRRAQQEVPGDSTLNTQHATLPLALYYTAFGAVTALGVGKVGAYANYFLELYAGLVWLVALGLSARTPAIEATPAAPRWGLALAGQWLLLLLAAGGLLRYYPSWSQTYSKPAGMIEGVNPPRLAFGRYGVWQDLRREANLLLTLDAANAALSDEVRAASAPIFTDVPGVAAQAGRQARLQAFEHRQLADSGAWDQRTLLLDLANGRVPLVVLDYLGNWLTPEMIALIRHRYAQDGSRGSYDLYRPVDPGPRAALDLPFPDHLRLRALYLSPSPGRTAYQPGELLTLTLGWTNSSADQPQLKTQNSELKTLVVVRLLDAAGAPVLEDSRPLLYGAFAPAAWPTDTEVQHMQPLRLPPGLPPGEYALEVALRGTSGGDSAPQRVGQIVLEAGAGETVGQHFIPVPLLDAWRQAGPDGLGEPLMPAVPFDGVVTQCYERGCLRLRDSRADLLPLGELVRLADLGVDGERPAVASPPATPEGPFGDFWAALGGASTLGAPISGELRRGDKLVLYTSYARLERPLDSDDVRLANVGVDYLRLPSIPYRWP